MSVYVTLTFGARVVMFTAASCAECGRRLMTLPGTPVIEVRSVAGPSGRGRVVTCPRCHALQEVIEHGSASIQ